MLKIWVGFLLLTARFFLLTVGTKIIADPEKCFQALISGKNLLILLRDRPCLELNYHFQ